MAGKENQVVMCPPYDPVQRKPQSPQPEDVYAMAMDLQLATKCVVECDHPQTHYCSNGSMTKTENQAALCPPCDPVQKSPSEDSMTGNLKHATKCLLECGHSPTYYCRKHKIFCCRALSHLHSYCENMVYIKEGHIYRDRESDIQETQKLLNALDNLLEYESTEIDQVNQKAKEFITEVRNNNKNDSNFKDIQEKVDMNQIKVVQVHVDRIVALQKHRRNIFDCLKTIKNVNLSSLQSIIARHKVFSFAQAQAEEGLKTLTSEILEMKMSIHDAPNTTRFDVSIESKKPQVSSFVSLFNKTLTSLFKHLFNRCTAQESRGILISCNVSLVASAERPSIQAGKRTPDGTHLPDNTILLSDPDNKQLIKLDENMGFLAKLPVAEDTWGVCVSSDGNCVHVVCDENKVVSYTLQGPWREIHRFETEKGARGIVCHGDRIVIGYWEYVVIYNCTGTEVSRINTSGSSAYPALSQDGRMLYHGDGRHYVVCRSMEDVTQEIWRYSLQQFYWPQGIDTDIAEAWRFTPKELEWPLGIDTDREGNVLFVGQSSYDIHQVSGDGKLNRILVNIKNMEMPNGLFTNRNNNTFCVTSDNGFGNVCVEMYRLDD